MANRYRMVDNKLVQLTNAEETARQEEETANVKIVATKIQAEQTRETKKTSAKIKLKALGLDDDEINTLYGDLT